jgi:Glycosyltransferase family 10 (fucosyltransferase) C-term
MNSNRDGVVVKMRQLGFRVDGLSTCLNSGPNKEGVRLPKMTSDDELNLQLKRKTISNYLFHLAFENTYEAGYVTEKVFDALYAGRCVVCLS